MKMSSKGPTSVLHLRQNPQTLHALLSDNRNLGGIGQITTIWYEMKHLQMAGVKYSHRKLL